jgi:diaminopimelate epimerase
VESADGLLYVVKQGDYYAMRMFNPDGSEAEMCGNGIRCVARLVRERYISDDFFTLTSGGGLYPTRRAELINGEIEAYGVDIKVRLTSPDFGFAAGAESHIDKAIPSLGEDMRFTALNLGNPHIVAAVEAIDMERLVVLGKAVTQLKDDFPKGINVSLYRKCGDNAIFVATYERGAGITYSCGTAMTASSTAATLLGICREGEEIEVYNRGGMVRCLCTIKESDIVTRLTGNATYQWRGVAEWNGEKITKIEKQEIFHNENEAYERFVEAIEK